MPPPPAPSSSSAAQEGDRDLLRRLWPHHVHQGPRNRLCRKGISFPSLFSLFTFHSPPVHHLFTTLFLAPALVLLVLCDVLIQGSADGIADSPVARRRRVHPQVQGARVPAVRGRGARRAGRERRERSRQGACVAAGDQNLQEGVPPPRLLALLFPLPPLGSSLAHCTLTPRTRPHPRRHPPPADPRRRQVRVRRGERKVDARRGDHRARQPRPREGHQRQPAGAVDRIRAAAAPAAPHRLTHRSPCWRPS